MRRPRTPTRAPRPRPRSAATCDAETCCWLPGRRLRGASRALRRGGRLGCRSCGSPVPSAPPQLALQLVDPLVQLVDILQTAVTFLDGLLEPFPQDGVGVRALS